LKTHQPKDIAILCRRRSSAEPIIKAFRKHNLPFNFVEETGFFQEPIIKDITAVLKAISNPLENNAEIVRILNRRNYDIKQIDIQMHMRLILRVLRLDALFFNNIQQDIKGIKA
jgi:superfamily I DNA/RNA helicase